MLHVGGAGAVAWSSFVTAVCDMKVLNTSVKMSVMADAVVPHTWLCLCRLKTLFTLKLPASVYMMNPGVPAGAVRGKTLSALYRSDAVLGVHTGYFYEHFDKKKSSHVVHDCVQECFDKVYKPLTWEHEQKKESVTVLPVRSDNFRGHRVITASAAVAKMAQSLAELEVSLDADQAGHQGKGVMRRCRGRPRLTDTDRAQRRLESRKKYDVRRVYLGESHKLWSELRRRTSLSDAGLAEYLILLNSTYGDKYQQKYCG